MICAKVFTSGNSQAVRIPKQFHIADSEVLIKKVGAALVLYPKAAPWENLRRSLSEFTEDFMEGGRGQPDVQEREAF